jgi:pyruvate/2-oxoglutarate/acetoin dehydrogenase E1 component/TPP-dependent pyruvate/acetoin dehydrogenase alpha subunit
MIIRDQKRDPRQESHVDKANSSRKAAARTEEQPFVAEEVIGDYRLAYQSRQASVIGRRDALSGRAKFGIFGDGKEVAQIALAKAFRKGDFRAGYYRDQTFMFALGIATIQELFAQLYAHADAEAEPSSAGRQMNAHFATRLLNSDGSWKKLAERYNSAADLSPTGSQMPKLVGLAYASRLYRELEELQQFDHFSHNGNEIAFGTIGNASCAEGLFWEAVNAVGVLQAPLVLSIWDDGYGISVTNEHQLTKESISELLVGFRRVPGSRNGYDIYTVPGWDYPALVRTYAKAAAVARKEQVPAIIHVVEMTQPQGHSTSGSHERYKPAERLAWEEEFDPIRKMREWIIDQGFATAAELDEMESEDAQLVLDIRDQAWEAYTAPLWAELHELTDVIEEIEPVSQHKEALARLRAQLLGKRHPIRRDLMAAVHNVLLTLRDESIPVKQLLIEWKEKFDAENRDRYSSHLYSRSQESALQVAEVKPIYSADAPQVNGSEIMNACFDALLARDPRVVAFGEDLGRLGDVNQGFAGLQAKYGPLRVSDTGIREATIIGQAIGLALRGLRPVAEIQYLDYVLYGLQILSDDLATLHWRTRGGQKAPAIIRTRGHRLEGIWHSGSPMAGLINLVRGMYVVVPRDMTRAAGFYNTLIQGDDPAIVVEVLNGYRLKERLPDNIGEFTVPLGVPEVLRAGSDVTIVTYGALCRIALEAAVKLAQVGIDVELIDAQCLLPFDRPGLILESLKKTSRILFLDEDVPGGATAYMMQKVIEEQGGYHWLDSEPRTLAAQEHRAAYGSDGNYWSKPNAEQIFETVYELMHEVDPRLYPLFYK